MHSYRQTDGVTETTSSCSWRSITCKSFRYRDLKKKKKLRGRSPQANSTYRATAACRQSYCQPLRIEGVAWSTQGIPTTVNLGFLDRSRYFFIQVPPQLSSRGWVDPVPEPLLLRKCGRAGNRTRDLWICSQKLSQLDHRGGPNIEISNLNRYSNFYIGLYYVYEIINQSQLFSYPEDWNNTFLQNVCTFL
jgi:hypothetical protein